MDTQAIQFGMMSSLRTNNVIIDTLVCMLIPVLFTSLLNSSTHAAVFVAYLKSIFGSKDPTVVTRRIETKQAFNSWGKVHDNDQHNHILQKAISIYLSDHLDMKSKSGRYELLEKTVPVQIDDSDSESSEEHYYYWNQPADDKDQVKKLAVGALPPLNEWIEVEDGVTFMHEVTNNNSEGGDNNKSTGLSQSTVTFLLSSSAPDASQRIDAFVTRAYTNYQDLIAAKHKKDKTRYMYIASSTSAEDAAVQQYKRYALGEDKTFESLFFEEKKPLLTLLDNFLNKSGKFGISGFPYKMGLLLHGPPGTGKTSLIKAIAQHTKRHIVNISLSKIKTNQELMDMMCDMKFGIAGEDLPIKLNYDDIVFVMEDIDCASNVVMARAPVDSEPVVEEVKENMTPDEKDEAAFSKALSDVIKSTGSSKYGPKDKLNLSGLLNVLDGVVDSPGRILIMTTNHPEKLDPALIRPGRVNKKMLLGHMTSRQAQLMVEHYFGSILDTKQRQSIDELFATKPSMSPAQIEQYCAEYDDVNDMLTALSAL